jgi:hypothetical protein
MAAAAASAAAEAKEHPPAPATSTSSAPKPTRLVAAAAAAGEGAGEPPQDEPMRSSSVPSSAGRGDDGVRAMDTEAEPSAGELWPRPFFSRYRRVRIQGGQGRGRVRMQVHCKRIPLLLIPSCFGVETGRGKI